MLFAYEEVVDALEAVQVAELDALEFVLLFFGLEAGHAADGDGLGRGLVGLEEVGGAVEVALDGKLDDELDIGDGDASLALDPVEDELGHGVHVS